MWWRVCAILSGAKDLGESTNPLTPREILHCVQNDVFVAGILLYTREAGVVLWVLAWREEFIMLWWQIAWVLFLIPVWQGCVLWV